MFADFMNAPADYSRHPELQFWRVPAAKLWLYRYLENRTALYWWAHTKLPRTVGTIIPANEIHMYPIMNRKYLITDINGKKKPENMCYAVIIPRSDGTYRVSEYYMARFDDASSYLCEHMPADLSLDMPTKIVNDKYVSMTDFTPVGGMLVDRYREARGHAEAAKLQLKKDFPEFFPKQPKAKRANHDTESDSDHEQALNKLPRV